MPVSQVIRARVPAELAVAFKARALSTGQSESELLRALLCAGLGVAASEGASAAVGDDEGTAARYRLDVRLPARLKDDIKRRALARGMPPSRWVASAVQALLTREPVLSSDEVLELRAATRELAAIGRNINQIAHVLNASHISGAGRTVSDQGILSKLDEVSVILAREREAIRFLIRASRGIWGIDGE